MKKIIVILLMSLLVRILIAPLFLEFPRIPHDYYHYVGAGGCFVQGKYLMADCISWAKVSESAKVLGYGPFFAALMGMTYLVGGENFLAYKIMSIIFDVGAIYLIYLIVKNIWGEKRALSIAVIYSLSILALLNSAVLGNDDIFVMFFALLSIYFLKKNFPLSAVFLVFAVMFKITAFLFLPPILLYIYRKRNAKECLKFLIVGAIFYSLLLSVFYYIAGDRAFNHIISKDYTRGCAIQSICNIIKLSTNMDFSQTVLPLLLISNLSVVLLFFKLKCRNLDYELFRNVCLIFIVSALFSGHLEQDIIFTFFFAICILYGEKLSEKYNYLYILLTIIPIVIYSVIFRWTVPYTVLDKLLLLVMLGFATISTYLKFGKVFTLIIFSLLLFGVAMANPLTILLPDINIDISHFTVIQEKFGDHIKSGKDFVGYSLAYAGSSFLLWVGLILLFKEVLLTKI